MPWTPQNDFEEEVVNLQPDHDFIFGYLSEPQYPRPTEHTEYAATKKLQEREQKAFGAANSAKLRVIQQVQRIANIKPVGEQPNLDDWDNNEHLEQETIGMMRHFGLGASVEHPLNVEATIASYPVPKENIILKNGRRKVALFLDDNMFKLREKVSDSSSGFESCNNSGLNKFRSDKDDSLASELDGDTSLSTSSSFSFATAAEFNDSSLSAAPSKISNQSFNQYKKLIEDTSLLSLNCSKSSLGSEQERSESFRTFSKSSWTPVSDDDDDEDLFKKKENWPVLSKNKISCAKSTAESNDLFNNAQTTDSNDEANNSKSKRENFLDRFIKPDKSENVDTKTSSDSTATTTTTTPPKPTTYASITKTTKSSAKKNKSNPPDLITNFPPFYTPRKMYALKRNAK